MARKPLRVGATLLVDQKDYERCPGQVEPGSPMVARGEYRGEILYRQRCSSCGALVNLLTRTRWRRGQRDAERVTTLEIHARLRR